MATYISPRLGKKLLEEQEKSNTKTVSEIREIVKKLYIIDEFSDLQVTKMYNKLVAYGWLEQGEKSDGQDQA